MDNPLDDLAKAETITFRSLTYSALWATQTNPQEICQITSLQQSLKSPKVQDLMSINTVIKRLKSPSREKYGLWCRKLSPPTGC